MSHLAAPVAVAVVGEIVINHPLVALLFGPVGSRDKNQRQRCLFSVVLTAFHVVDWFVVRLRSVHIAPGFTPDCLGKTSSVNISRISFNIAG